MNTYFKTIYYINTANTPINSDTLAAYLQLVKVVKDKQGKISYEPIRFLKHELKLDKLLGLNTTSQQALTMLKAN